MTHREATYAELDYLLVESVRVDGRRKYHARKMRECTERLAGLDRRVMAIRRELAEQLETAVSGAPTMGWCRHLPTRLGAAWHGIWVVLIHVIISICRTYPFSTCGGFVDEAAFCPVKS